MKFYNRDKELASLEKVRRVSFSVHSQMTVLTVSVRPALYSRVVRILLQYTYLLAEAMKQIFVYDLLQRSDRHLIFMYRNLPILQKYSVS